MAQPLGTALADRRRRRWGRAGAGESSARAGRGAEDEVRGQAQALDAGIATRGSRFGRAPGSAAHGGSRFAIVRVRGRARAGRVRDIRRRGDARRAGAGGGGTDRSMSGLAPLAPDDYLDIVRRALAEDVGPGDVTTRSTVPDAVHGRGVLLAKSVLVVAGLDVARAVFAAVGGGAMRFTARAHDGESVTAGTVIATVEGPARALLTAERTALDLLQRMSGIATATRQYVDAAAGRIIILDTRKTTPMLRALEKYAVRAGGGRNHRSGLYDQVLIKDNHVRLAGGVRKAVESARREAPGLTIEVEAQSLAEAAEAADAGADVVLLD